MNNTYQGLLAALVLFLMDWSFFASMANVIEIARLRNGEEDVDLTYDIRKIWRPICIILGTIIFTVSNFFDTDVRDVFYGLMVIDIIVMLALTYYDCTSR